MLVSEIAQYLHQEGLVVFDETGITGDCFISVLPSTPDEAVALFPTGGPGSDGKLGYDTPTFQVRARGTKDPRPAFSRLKAIYDALHGLHEITLPGGTYLVGCWGIQSEPVHVGRDENGRHEYTLNFRCEVRSLTANRE